MARAHRSKPLIGIISDPGLYPDPTDAETAQIPTPYGSTTTPIVLTSLGGTDVALLSRRGDQALPPAMLPSRANAWAFAKLGVKAVVVVTAAGSLDRDLDPGTFVVTDQIIDHTWGRPNTFYDQGRLVQVAAPEPFDPKLRRLAISALRSQRVPMRPTGTVLVIQGPRFATRAESRWNAAAGAELVNMQLAPFVHLALELGMGVCNLSFITDRDAADEAAPEDAVTSGLIARRMADASPVIRRVIWSMLLDLQHEFRPQLLVPADAVAEVLARPIVNESGEAQNSSGLSNAPHRTRPRSAPHQILDSW